MSIGDSVHETIFVTDVQKARARLAQSKLRHFQELLTLLKEPQKQVETEKGALNRLLRFFQVKVPYEIVVSCRYRRK